MFRSFVDSFLWQNSRKSRFAESERGPSTRGSSITSTPSGSCSFSRGRCTIGIIEAPLTSRCSSSSSSIEIFISRETSTSVGARPSSRSIFRGSSRIEPRMRPTQYVSNFTPRDVSNLSIASSSPNIPDPHRSSTCTLCGRRSIIRSATYLTIGRYSSARMFRIARSWPRLYSPHNRAISSFGRLVTRAMMDIPLSRTYPRHPVPEIPLPFLFRFVLPVGRRSHRLAHQGRAELPEHKPPQEAPRDPRDRRAHERLDDRNARDRPRDDHRDGREDSQGAAE